VILHELCHLVVANHNAQFWALVGRYPRAERARGYLEGISAATGLDMSDE
jgi:predicted metal-dependent hydrolase